MTTNIILHVGNFFFLKVLFILSKFQFFHMYQILFIWNVTHTNPVYQGDLLRLSSLFYDGARSSVRNQSGTAQWVWGRCVADLNLTLSLSLSEVMSRHGGSLLCPGWNYDNKRKQSYYWRWAFIMQMILKQAARMAPGYRLISMQWL